MQKIRFTNEELQIIKQIFAESEDDKMLKILRKVFLQLPIDTDETAIIKTTFRGKKDTMAAINKMFLPDLDGEAPILQCGDAWSFFSPRIEDLDLDRAKLQIKSRKKVIDYLRQQLDFLGEEKNQKIVFADFVNDNNRKSNDSEGEEKNKKIVFADFVNDNNRKSNDSDATYIGLITYNFIINYVEQRLNEIKILAGRKDETPEETIKRIQQNSNK